MSYTKLFGSIIHSTIWREDNPTRLVWVTMLALVDRDGIVEASIPGLADAARVTVTECHAALQTLLSPDPYSRSKDDEGRRIREVPGGWLLVNYELYRERATAEQTREKAAERQRRKRQRDRNGTSHPVTPVTQSNDIAEAEAEAEAFPPSEEIPARRAAKLARSGGKAKDSKPVEIPDPLEIPDALVDALMAKHEATREQILRIVPETVWYWKQGKGAGTKRSLRGWLTTFANRISQLARSGDLYTERPSGVSAGKPPGLLAYEQTQLTPLEQRRFERMKASRREKADEAKRIEAERQRQLAALRESPNGQ